MNVKKLASDANFVFLCAWFPLCTSLSHFCNFVTLELPPVQCVFNIVTALRPNPHLHVLIRLHTLYMINKTVSHSLTYLLNLWLDLGEK